jgi:signal transduction histidine kinase/CheY-like chemotaxis protein
MENENTLVHLKHVDEEWKELRRVSLLSLRSNAQSVSKNRFVRQLLSQAAETVIEMTHVVQLMQYQSEMKLRRLGSMLLLMTVFGAIIFLLIVYFVYSRIVVPLDSTVRALNDSTATLEVEKRRAEKASQAKSDFLSRMSHELRTPMNAILGFAQLLKYDKKLNAEQQGNTGEILKAGHHLLELINEVLDLARIESGHADLSFESVKLSGLVDECFLLIAPMAKNQGITISRENIGEYFVRVDRTRCKQILLNLLSNAIKYNSENGKVELDVRPINDAELRITISDTGNGIADDQLPELFLPFNRLDARDGEVEGTGIGLTISQQLVEMMGGRIGVDSKLGVGSRFWVELPIDTSVQSEEHARPEDKIIESPVRAESYQHTLLYIEDNPANLNLVSKILAHRKHIKLLTAHDPRLGLELAMVHHPDLVLLDINMPYMDGYQVLEALKTNEGLQHIPVIAVTANAMIQDVDRGKSAGFSDYLTKPIDVPHFLETIDHYLEP